MALSLTQLEAVTTEYQKNRDLTDIYFTENILLYKLLGNGNMENFFVTAGDLVDGGTKIRVFLEHARANTGSYGSTTRIPRNKVDILNAARFRWAGYYASNTIDLDDQVQNSGDEALVNLVYSKFKNMEKTIRDKMGADVFASAADGNSLLGLGNLFSTVTATSYGDIAEDDMALWKANVITDAADIKYSTIQAVWRTASVGQNASKKPNLAITTDVLLDGYKASLQTQQRFSDVKLVQAGFTNILHDGAPIVSDDNQASGYFDALNLNYLSIKTHKDYAFTTPKWQGTVDEPDTLTADTRWIGQLVTNNRKAHCRRTGMTVAA